MAIERLKKAESVATGACSLWHLPPVSRQIMGECVLFLLAEFCSGSSRHKVIIKNQRFVASALQHYGVPNAVSCRGTKKVAQSESSWGKMVEDGF